MYAVLRAASIYCIVWLIFRLAGRRTMSEISTFDFILLLICGEATQQALLGEDFTVTDSAIVVLTLVVIDGALTRLRARWPRFERIMEGTPVVVYDEGRPVPAAMRHERIDESDILEAARHQHGIASLESVRGAVLEANGSISVIPYS